MAVQLLSSCSMHAGWVSMRCPTQYGSASLVFLNHGSLRKIRRRRQKEKAPKEPRPSEIFLLLLSRFCPWTKAHCRLRAYEAACVPTRQDHLRIRIWRVDEVL